MTSHSCVLDCISEQLITDLNVFIYICLSIYEFAKLTRTKIMGSSFNWGFSHLWVRYGFSSTYVLGYHVWVGSFLSTMCSVLLV